MNYQNVIADDYILKPNKIYLLLVVLDKTVVSFHGTISSVAVDNSYLTIVINTITENRKITIRQSIFQPVGENTKWFIIDPDYNGDNLTGLDDMLDFSTM